jgi:hypothetical protein
LDKRKNEDIDIIAGLFSLLDRNPEIANEQLLALLSIFTLLSIVNLIKPVNIQLPTTISQSHSDGEGNLVETLTGLLNNKNLNTGDLASLIGKNPGAIMSMMNLLSSMKEQRNTPRGEESSKEGKKITHEEAQSTIIKDKT